MTRIQRHFRPLTVRSRFSLERLLGLSPLTARQIFPTLSYESLEDTITEEPAPPSQINKPLGEAGKNYRLLKESQLDKSTFTTIEVCPILLLRFVRLVPDISVIEIHPGIGRQRFGYDCNHLKARAKFPQLRTFQGM
jgi:hypothetical protein